MEIRDPVHGSIHILDQEIPVIQNNFFQRLRGIKQLGFSEYVFPGATHTRFLHSIGVMSVGEKAFNRLFPEHLGNQDLLRLKETLKMACLLHDIGHAPLSHSTESVMPHLSRLKLPAHFISSNKSENDRQATHEDYTIKAIADSSLGLSFQAIESNFGVNRLCVADLILGTTRERSYFTVGGVDYFPLLHQLVSSEMDCDRMDYLLRDSYFCGVSYGNYDLDWLLDNLQACVIDNRAYLGITERAVVTFDDFLLSRYHMFVMVYFHYRPVCLEQLLLRYFKSSPNEYTIPGDIEAYLEHDDHFLMKVLKNSSNPYAQNLIQNRIPEKIYESFNEKQLQKLENIQNFLDQENIEYIRGSSSGRLSKYYTGTRRENLFHIKVVRTVKSSMERSYSNIDEATDLFLKFSKSHAINRLHFDMAGLSPGQKQKVQEIIDSEGPFRPK